MQEKNRLNLAKIVIIFLGILIPSFIFLGPLKGPIYSATSDTVNLQGKIVRNDAGYEGLNVTVGNPACVVTGSGNDTCDFRVRYYDASTAGNLLLTEEFSNIEIGQYLGVFNISLGSDLSPVAGVYSSFSGLIQGEDDVYVEMGFDPAGSNTYTEVFTRMPLEATAYAVRAKYADNATGATAMSWSGLQDPSSDLTLQHSTRKTLFNWATGTGTNDLFSLTSDASATGTGALMNVQTGTGASLMPLRVRAGTIEGLMVDNQGRVGIGTTSLVSLLTVGSTGGFQVNSSGQISAASGIISSGTIRFSGLSTGLVKSSSDGTLSVDTNTYATSEKGVYYVEGNTTGTAGTWTGSNADILSYYDGLVVAYKIGIAGATTTRLDINGFGERIVYRDTGNLTTHLPVNTIVLLTYTTVGGTGRWVWADYDSDSTESYTVRWNTSVKNNSTDINHGYKLTFEKPDGTFAPVSVGGGITANSNTISSQTFKLGGQVLYYGASTDIAVNGIYSNVYEGVSSAEMEYWSNRGTGVWATAGLPIYLVAVPSDDGNTFTLVGSGTTGVLGTQTLPTTEDGLIYIQIGFMNNTTDNWRLSTAHPIFEFKNGVLRNYMPKINKMNSLFVMNNVGIGTTVPGYKLDVSGGTGIVGQFSGRVIGGDAVNTNEFVTKSQLDAIGGSVTTYWQRTSPNLSPINANDNILPNTSGDLGAAGLRWGTIYGNTGSFSTLRGNSTLTLLPSSDGINAVNIKESTGTTEILSVDTANSRVGIGTTSPDSALHIAGQVKITGGTPGANKVLTSDIVGLASWSDLSSIGGVVTSVTGTANQITADVSTGDVTLSIPMDFRAPGTVNAVNGVYTGATAGTQRIDASGNLLNIGTITFAGNDVVLSRTLANVLSLASGDSFNLVSGSLQVGGTEVITSGRLVMAANGSATTPSFSFSSDTNTGMYSGGTDILKLATAGLDRVTILADGKVGVGTTSPGKALDVAGDIRLRGDTATLNFYRDTSPADMAYIKYDDVAGSFDIAANSKDIRFLNQISWAESMRITSGGSVGIGTTSPVSLFSVGVTSQFQVDTSGDITKIKNLSYTWPTAHTTNGYLKNNGTGGLSWAEVNAVQATGTPYGSATEGPLAFWTSASTIAAPTPYGLYWDDINQFLGIGTNTPSAPLDIAGGTGGSIIKNSSGDITIEPAENLIISKGDVGISTDNPLAKLHVKGNQILLKNEVDADVGFAMDSGSTATYRDVISFRDRGTDIFALEKTATNAFQLYDYAGTGANRILVEGGSNSGISFRTKGTGDFSFINDITTRVTIKSGGNMGVGTNNPSAPLTVGTLNGTSLWAQFNNSDFNGTDTGSGVNFRPTAGSGNAGTIIQAFKAGTAVGDLLLNSYGGNVGIGTTGPGYKLDVSGDIRGTGQLFLNNSNPTLYFQDTDQYSGMIHVNNNLMYILSGSAANSTTWTMHGSYWPLTINMVNDVFDFGGETHFMEGNVGIGTASPLGKFVVYGGGNNPNNYNTYPADTNRVGLIINSYNLGEPNAWLNVHDIVGSSANTASKIRFLTADWWTYSPVERMVINPNGNVGIGTTSPTGRFEVFGGSTTFYLRTSSATSGWFSETGALEVKGDGNAGTSVILATSGHAAVNDRYGIGILRQSDWEFKCGLAGACYADGGWNGAADFAEYFYTTSSNLQKGDIVTLSAEENPDNVPMGVMTSASKGDIPLGVVSTFPGFVGVLSEDVTNATEVYEKDPHYQVVGLLGQLPVKVTSINGNIKKKDPISISSIPKYGAKAIEKGHIVGYATQSTDHWNMTNCPLVSNVNNIVWPEDTTGTNKAAPCFRLPDGTYVGKIMVYLNVSLYDPSVERLLERIEELETLYNSIPNENEIYNILTLGQTSGINTLKINASFSPTTNNKYDLGNSTNRWKDIYAQGTVRLGSSTDSGGIKYDTETKQLKFTNDGQNWIAVGSPKKSVLLSAQYPGSVVSDNTDVKGTMTTNSTGVDNNSMNYYEWVSSKSDLNTNKIKIRYQIPSDFKQWGDGGITFKYATESINKEENKLDFYVYDQSSDVPETISLDNVSSVGEKWESVEVLGLPFNKCSTPGDVCIFVIEMSSSKDYYTRVGDIEIKYERNL